jgi:hypothetical protein
VLARASPILQRGCRHNRRADTETNSEATANTSFEKVYQDCMSLHVRLYKYASWSKRRSLVCTPAYIYRDSAPRSCIGAKASLQTRRGTVVHSSVGMSGRCVCAPPYRPFLAIDRSSQ